MTRDIIYLDYNATTPLDQEVYDSMVPYLTHSYGNPSSNYSLGYEAKVALKNSRGYVAELINADESEIIFTSGASEANSTIIKGIALSNPNKKHIITSSIEHPSILETCHYLQKYHGYRITKLPVDTYGIVDVSELKKAIHKQTCLVTVMMVNNEVGSIQPIEEISEICTKNKIHFHCDVVQGVGKLAINVQNTNFDSLSISGHKIHGPKGVGCLFLRKGIHLHPLIHGGSQEMGIRSGTENVAGIIGFGIAARIAKEELYSNYNLINELKKVFIKELTLLNDWSINSDLLKTVPSTLNIQFPGIRGEALAAALNQMGICVSIASACSASSSKLSYVLKAMGKCDDEIRSSIRISFGKYTTKAEVIEAVNSILMTVTKLRFISSKTTVIEGNMIKV